MDSIPHPSYWKPTHPSMLRRNKDHDYHSKCFYLITLRANPKIGRLSEIVIIKTFDKKEGVFSSKPGVNYSVQGKIIYDEIVKFNLGHSNVEISRYIIMPDHVHLLFYMKERNEKDLSFYVGSFKGNCTRSFSEKSDLLEKEGLFEKGFNDKIVYRKNQLNTFKNYILDNPRRYLIVKQAKKYFYNMRTIRIGEEEFSAMGNFLLLEHPIMSAVVVSSRYTPEEREKYYSQWRETFRQGGVLVGAFVSEAEKKIKYGALSHGGKVIQIKPEGFGERYKPSKEDLPYCANGQLLEIAFQPYQTRKSEFNRKLCLEMNDFARKIADLPSC